ncbi:chemotaxis protein CheB [Planctomycetaceae bacterium SH139]
MSHDANIPSRANAASKTVVIVDDSLLQRTMLTKYLHGDDRFSLVGTFRSLAELCDSVSTEAPSFLVVCSALQPASQETGPAELAKRWPQTLLLLLRKHKLDYRALQEQFAARASSIEFEPQLRPAEVAKLALGELVRCLPQGARAAEAPPAVASKLIGNRTGEARKIPATAPLVIKTPLAINTPAAANTPAAINIPHQQSRPNPPRPRLRAVSLPTRLVVIGGSTGAPAAVTKLLQQLPADFPLPIAISLHMLEDFTERLAQSLDRATKLRCLEATNNTPLLPGFVYVAKGDHHLTVHKNEQGRFLSRLNQKPPEHFARPSVNQLFRSAAKAAGPGTIAVMLTGIGSDGLEGTELLFERGAFIVAQDEASSTVWGMPAAVVQAGYANEVLAPGDIGQLIHRKITVEQKRGAV